jgi:hypothetical protein
MPYSTRKSVMKRVDRSRSPCACRSDSIAAADVSRGDGEELGHTGYVPFLAASDYLIESSLARYRRRPNRTWD